MGKPRGEPVVGPRGYRLPIVMKDGALNPTGAQIETAGGIAPASGRRFQPGTPGSICVTLAAGAAAVWWCSEAAGPLLGLDPRGNADHRYVGLAVLASLAGAAHLLIHWLGSRRRRALNAIAEAVEAAGAEGRDTPCPTLREGLGPEAAAWNRLVRRYEEARGGEQLRRVSEALSSRPAGRSDLDDAADAMPQGLILIDQRMRVRYANGAAISFLGLDETKVRGAVLHEIAPDGAVAEALRVWDPAARGRIVLESKQGTEESPCVLRWIVRPVRRDDSASAMVVIEDITQQRIAETASRSFVTQATHELRTPLTNIRLYIETALDEGERDAVLMKKCLNVINSESRRLERIVADLLSTAEIEAGCLQIRRDDLRLSEMIDEMRTEYEAQAAEKRVRLVFDVPPKVPVIQGDRDMLALALHNLIGNALKYTPGGGEVTVRVEVESSRVSVEVSDTGIGISEQDQQRVFEKFYRANDRRLEGITGSGLGLALAREVARLHGGDIRVHSELNKGSTFTLVIPGVDEAQAA